MKQPCQHNYARAPGLLPDSALRVCAVCFTETCIGEVKLAQAALARRGGIFESLKAGPEPCATDIDGKRWMTHKDWTSRWKKAKLNCWRLVAILEKLQDERFDMVEEWGIDEALYLWEVAKDECWQVPGCRYVANPVSKGGEVVSRLQAMEIVPEPATKEEESEGSWEIVKRRWKKRSRPLEYSSRENSIPRNKGVPSTAVPKPMKNSKSTPNEDMTPATSHSRKSVSIDLQATIIPCDDTPAETMSHHEHTIAEQSRKRLSYTRCSRSYTPFCWASPEGYEKDDTSHYKTPWATIDQLQGAKSDVDLDSKGDALTEKAVVGEEKRPPAFRARLPTWQWDKTMLRLSSSHQEVLMRAPRDYHAALTSEQKEEKEKKEKKRWTDAESER